MYIMATYIVIQDKKTQNIQYTTMILYCHTASIIIQYIRLIGSFVRLLGTSRGASLTAESSLMSSQDFPDNFVHEI